MEQEVIEQTEVVNSSEELNFDTFNVEEIKPFYHNGALITPPYRLYRLNSPNGRIYFRFQDEARFMYPIMYMGTGSVTSQMPTPKQLQKYTADKGWLETQREMSMWSLYGSFSDSRIAEFISKGRFETGLDGLPSRLAEYFYDQRFWIEPSEFNHMAKCIKRDMIGFNKFIIDRKVEFVFIEYPVISEIDGMATPIDFGAFFDTEVAVDKIKKNGEVGKQKAYETRRVFGLFNYKTGKIWDSHGIQCMAERNMFMESHPEFTDLPVRSYNITIREYKTMNWVKYRPTSDYGKPYELKDWTDEANEDDFRDYLNLAKRKREKYLNKKVTTISGDMKMGDDVLQFVQTKTLKEIIMDGSWQKYGKTNEGIQQDFLVPRKEAELV